MIIINADDWGRARAETDAALSCYREGRITSVTAMVFMDDSDRAAELAKDAGLEVGLHLNLSQPFRKCGDGLLRAHHYNIVRHLTRSKYFTLIYNPLLREAFQYVYQAQVDEFIRLYGRPPSHIDGHQHMHLCANMLIDRVIPAGEKVRRGFTFFPGEKGFAKMTYRKLIDRWLAHRYRMSKFFFDLAQSMQGERMARIVQLARTSAVEIMAHPVRADERAYLMAETYRVMLQGLERGTYSSI